MIHNKAHAIYIIIIIVIIINLFTGENLIQIKYYIINDFNKVPRVP